MRKPMKWRYPNKEVLLFVGTDGVGIGSLVGCLKCSKCNFTRLIYESWLETAKTEKYNCLQCGSPLVFEGLEKVK